MSWIMRDYKCSCNEAWEDMVDNRGDQSSQCPACGNITDYVAVTLTAIKAFSMMDPDTKRRTMLKRSADHTLKEIKKEPEKHGEVGIKIAREATTRSK